jgi:hypothetical protein
MSSRRRTCPVAASVGLAVVVLVVGAGPASAATSFAYTDEPVTEVLEPCGAVYSYVGEHTGRFVQDGQGDFVRVVRQDVYRGTITYQDVTYRADDHQTHHIYIDRNGVPTAANNGQGLFTHLPRAGVAFFDQGHFVFDDVTGATIKTSAKVVDFDDDDDFGAAVCQALQDAAREGA